MFNEIRCVHVLFVATDIRCGQEYTVCSWIYVVFTDIRCGHGHMVW